MKGLNEPRELTECRSGLSEFHTVVTDTEKAHDEKLEVTAGFTNRWADDEPSCQAA